MRAVGGTGWGGRKRRHTLLEQGSLLVLNGLTWKLIRGFQKQDKENAGHESQINKWIFH